jgi:hypothetical protein
VNSFTHTRLLALVLAAIGLGIFATKVLQLDYPLTPGERTTTWDFEIYLDFDTSNQPVRLETYIPSNGENRRVSQEQFYNGAFGLRLNAREGDGRTAIWTYRYPNDRKVLRYRARLLGETLASPLPESMQRKLRRAAPEAENDLERQAFLVWSTDLRRRSADDESLADLVLEEIFVDGDVDEVEALLSPTLTRQIARLALARDVLTSQGIPARVANGVYMDQARRRAEIRHWLEYHADGADRRYFPGPDPEEFFTIWHGTNDFIRAEGISDLDLQVSLQPVNADVADVMQRVAKAEGSAMQWFSFNRLPITTQLVYQVLVTIPVGILMLVFLRQFIGLQTLGTFMPVLIGIAFRETALVNGVILFTALIALGLAVRFYLEKLKLLLVPRLATVVVFIVICMAVIAQIMANNGQRIGLSISLFPMVILTMTIERMSIAWEEYSATEAIKQGIGSLMVAAASYLVMTNTHVEYLMFNFPELLLVIMAICLLMGKYTGLRLSELIRFRELDDRK